MNADVVRILEAINSSVVKDLLLPEIIKNDLNQLEHSYLRSTEEESHLRFNEEERVAWLNSVIKVLWPHLSRLGSQVRSAGQRTTQLNE